MRNTGCSMPREGFQLVPHKPAPPPQPAKTGLIPCCSVSFVCHTPHPRYHQPEYFSVSQVWPGKVKTLGTVRARLLLLVQCCVLGRTSDEGARRKARYAG